MSLDETGSLIRQDWRAAAVRFAIASFTIFATNLGVTIALHELGNVPPSVAYAVALTIVFFQSFFLLRYFIFGRQSSPGWTQFAMYAPSSVTFRGLEYGLFVLLQGVVGIDYRVAVITVAGLSLVWKFLFYGRVVFRG
jgi:putative flippase GtrA